MSSLKAAQIHERPFRAAKGPVQPLAALDSPFTLRQKDLIFRHLSSAMGTHVTQARGLSS